MAETRTRGDRDETEMKETIEHYLVHDQVPADVREDVVDLYDEGEYRRALELAMNHW